MATGNIHIQPDFCLSVRAQALLCTGQLRTARDRSTSSANCRSCCAAASSSSSCNSHEANPPWSFLTCKSRWVKVLDFCVRWAKFFADTVCNWANRMCILQLHWQTRWTRWQCMPLDSPVNSELTLRKIPGDAQCLWPCFNYVFEWINFRVW